MGCVKFFIENFGETLRKTPKDIGSMCSNSIELFGVQSFIHPYQKLIDYIDDFEGSLKQFPHRALRKACCENGNNKQPALNQSI